jgi:hypothetical protein
VHKVSINLKPDEHLETHEWIEVAESYLKEMGFENSPYLVVQHREKDHEHIHIVTSRVDFNGDVISDSFERKRVRTWANCIEEQYNLAITPEKAPQKGLTRIEIEQSIKTKQIPPKLQLQTIIGKTLEQYPETSDFINSLSQQNVSVKFRANDKKEITGVSFAVRGRAFKGTSLGTNFTWNGLQKNGLIYEPERHYARLEESIGRASRKEFAGTEITVGGVRSANDDDPVARTDKIGSRTSGRGKDEGFSASGIESANGIGQNPIGTQTISQRAGADEQFVEKSGGKVGSGNEEKLRRLGQSGGGETQATGQIESEIYEESTGEKTFQTVQQINWSDLEDEFFRQQETERIRLLNQSSGSNLLPASEPIDTAQAIALRGGNLSGTGNATLDGNGAGDNLPAPFSGVGSISNSESALDAYPPNVLDNDDNAGTILGTDVSVYGNFSNPVSAVRDSVSDGGTGEPVHEELEDFSAKLRKSLQTAESTAAKTLSLEEDLKVEEAEKIKFEKEHIELEMEEVRVLSM